MKTQIKPAAVGALGIAGALLLWQYTATGPMIGSALPTPGRAMAELATLLAAGTFWADLADTILIALSGLAISAVAGIAAGLLIGSFSPVRYATMAVLEFLKPIPPIVVLPLVVLVLGPTAQMS
ncbi:MAG TPA: nitrate ABC transporter permease, partial [Arthrobacter sp.]|nr:nitrate ABC transporter permease [Arthrobacter sp.]